MYKTLQPLDEPTIVGILLFFVLLFLWRVMRVLKRYAENNPLRKYRTLKKIKKLEWDAFEQLCMALFQKQGWRVQGNEKKGADGGVDLWMKRRMRSAIVQCKRYDDAMVGIKVIREMYGLLHEYQVDEAYVVTSSRFTKECYRFAEEKPITLIDGETLVMLIRKHY